MKDTNHSFDSHKGFNLQTEGDSHQPQLFSVFRAN